MTASYKVERWSGIMPPNPAMLRSQLVTEGYEVFQWADSPGAVYGLHMHDEDQSHWIISGSIELTIETIGTVVLEAGDRDFMPAGCYHSARVVGDVPVVYLIGAKKAAAPASVEIEDDSIDNIISSALKRLG
jgi:mannose-6-phosphate isomerase-like protein (cupin superfamily)